MSTELVPAGWNAIASHQAGADNPLKLIPADMRRAAAVLYMTNSHLLPNSLALCAQLRIDAEHGLRPADLEVIVKALTGAERRSKHRFAADLLADLASLVALAIQRRRAADATAVRRGEAAAARQETALASRLAADLFRIDGGDR